MLTRYVFPQDLPALDIWVMRSHCLINLLVPKALFLKTILQRLRVKVPYFCHPQYLHLLKFQNVLSWFNKILTKFVCGCLFWEAPIKKCTRCVLTEIGQWTLLSALLCRLLDSISIVKKGIASLFIHTFKWWVFCLQAFVTVLKINWTFCWSSQSNHTCDTKVNETPTPKESDFVCHSFNYGPNCTLHGFNTTMNCTLFENSTILPMDHNKMRWITF